MEFPSPWLRDSLEECCCPVTPHKCTVLDCQPRMETDLSSLRTHWQMEQASTGQGVTVTMSHAAGSIVRSAGMQNAG
ncbi:hypothetical protein GN956_G11668 [Arapaima gigas]